MHAKEQIARDLELHFRRKVVKATQDFLELAQAADLNYGDTVAAATFQLLSLGTQMSAVWGLKLEHIQGLVNSRYLAQLSKKDTKQ